MAASSQRYMVTARKYRPARFEELVAQGHVSETLKNAIRLDRLAHAYLFSGPRGVGKTTAARILAKAINCTTPLEDRDDGAEPCRMCESCQSFEEGRSLGIFEIDAASNNKVDDIRELRDTVRVPPQGSKKKVYIIDEVHMLSNQAFNALLKTLEEPPPHVLFIFATTEPHKVLPTILSRCQRFDFRRIPVPEIVQRLREICEAENISADEESLMLLAKKGDGALRDALSAFDQAVSLCGKDLTYAELVKALGVVDVDLYFRLTEHISQRNSSGVLRLVEEVVSSGYDLQEFLAGVAQHFRNLLVLLSVEDTSLIQAATKTRKRYAEQAQRFSETDVLRLLMVAGDAEEDVKSSAQPRLKLEIALLKMASLTRVASLEQALAQLDRIEKAIEQGDAINFTETSPSSPKKNSSSEGSPKDSPPQEAPAAATRSKESDTKSEETQAPSEKPESTPETDDAPGTPHRSSGESPSRSREKAPSSTQEPDPPYKSLFNRPALGGSGEDSAGPEGSGSDNGSVATLQAPPSAAKTSAVSDAPAEIGEHWEEFVSSIRTEKIMVGSYLQRSRPIMLESQTLHIAVPDVHSRDLLNKHERYLLQQLPADITHAVDGFEFVIQNDLEDDGNAETDLERDPYEKLKQMRKENDVVRALFDKFGGEIVH